MLPGRKMQKRGLGRKVLLAIFAVLLTAASGWYLKYRHDSNPSVPEAVSWAAQQDDKTPVVEYQASLAETAPANASQDVAVSIPSSYNLAVPFTTQAPHATWDERDEDACEEASLLMAHRYYGGRSIASPEDADEALNEIITWENEHLSTWKSTPAEDILLVAREMLGYDTATLLRDPTVEVIKQNIAGGHPVLVPAAGRELGNPFFKSPGPLYHMLVIKGYNETELITNDPGTRRGADYRYKYDTLLNANHDWNGGDVTSGARVMIVLK